MFFWLMEYKRSDGQVRYFYKIPVFVQDLIRTKVGFDVERMNLQASSETLKRCLKSLS